MCPQFGKSIRGSASSIFHVINVSCSLCVQCHLSDDHISIIFTDPCGCIVSSACFVADAKFFLLLLPPTAIR